MDCGLRCPQGPQGPQGSGSGGPRGSRGLWVCWTPECGLYAEVCWMVEVCYLLFRLPPTPMLLLLGKRC